MCTKRCMQKLEKIYIPLGKRREDIITVGISIQKIILKLKWIRITYTNMYKPF